MRQCFGGCVCCVYGVLDYVGGRRDLEDKIVRTIGDPSARFAEDALRMLRAVRFAAQLGFEIEESTKKAIIELAPTITKVSRERIREELLKLLTADYPVRGLTLLFATGLVRYIIDMPTHVQVARMLERFERFPTKDPKLALAMFLVAFNEVYAYEIAETLKLSSEEMEVVVGAVDQREYTVLHLFHQAADGAQLKRFARKPGARYAVLLAEQDEFMGYDALEGFTLMVGQRFHALTPEEISPKPLVTGHDLVAMGMTPGPHFKMLLEKVEDIQLRGGFSGGTDREAALSFVRVTGAFYIQ